MQRQNNNNEPKTYCQSCGKYILTQNYLLHEGRCQKLSQLKSSRVSQLSQNKQKQSQFSENSQRRTPYSLKNASKQKIFTGMKKNKKNEFEQKEQKIPCYFCGYQQTLAQLDEHPKKCQHWQVECPFCKSKYPKSLMENHKQICQKNPQNIQRSQRNYQRNRMRRNDRPQQLEEFSSQQDIFVPMFAQRRNRNLYRPSPLMNIFSEFFNEEPFERRQNVNQPFVNIFTFESQGNNGPQIFFRSNSADPMIFIQLIEQLTRRANPNQNPGLRPEQLSRLNKVKYHKKGQQPDLCTICYCEFQQDQQVIQLKCKHFFHQQCIFEWLKRVSTCPVCKTSMRQQNNQHQQQSRSNRQERQRRNQFQQDLDMEEEHFRF